MGWGTSFKTEIYLNRQVFTNVEHLKDAIEDCVDTIAHQKDIIKMMVAADTKNILLQDETIEDLLIKINSCFDLIAEEERKLFSLRLYLEYVQENNIDLSKKPSDE